MTSSAVTVLEGFEGFDIARVTGVSRGICVYEEAAASTKK